MSKQKLILGMLSGMLMAGLALSNPAMAGKDLTEAEVPEAALKWFKKTYPNATKVEWEQDRVNMKRLKGVTIYEVEFEDEYGIDHEVKLTAEGKLVKGELD